MYHTSNQPCRTCEMSHVTRRRRRLPQPGNAHARRIFSSCNPHVFSSCTTLLRRSKVFGYHHLCMSQRKRVRQVMGYAHGICTCQHLVSFLHEKGLVLDCLCHEFMESCFFYRRKFVKRCLFYKRASVGCVFLVFLDEKRPLEEGALGFKAFQFKTPSCCVVPPEAVTPFVCALVQQHIMYYCTCVCACVWVRARACLILCVRVCMLVCGNDSVCAYLVVLQHTYPLILSCAHALIHLRPHLSAGHMRHM